MNTVILPMAYRRYRHSIRRPFMFEGALPKMKNDSQLNAKPGELESHRVSKTFVSDNNNVILARARNLSNDSVVTV